MQEYKQHIGYLVLWEGRNFVQAILHNQAVRYYDSEGMMIGVGVKGRQGKYMTPTFQIENLYRIVKVGKEK